MALGSALAKENPVVAGILRLASRLSKDALLALFCLRNVLARDVYSSLVACACPRAGMTREKFVVQGRGVGVCVKSQIKRI